jgi:hypothetical protein
VGSKENLPCFGFMGGIDVKEIKEEMIGFFLWFFGKDDSVFRQNLNSFSTENTKCENLLISP